MTPKPPTGYPTWLDYAVANMPTRDLSTMQMGDVWPGLDRELEREEMAEAATNELEELRRQLDELLDAASAAAHVSTKGIKVVCQWSNLVASMQGGLLAAIAACEEVPDERQQQET